MDKKLSTEDVSKLAKLARLKLTDQEKEKYANELSGILDYVELLSKVDVGDLKPTHQVTGLKNVMREDEIIDYGYDVKSLMNNVKEEKDGYIKVKRMIG
ncbi:MAG: Asp-tRNA(Asn)/Glu-tRNA(Gln) amidotransferase subunit GatC [bacterium]|jgi:aspartyl-tRNA(Asn)/glutamyl-tRNA(Gln) amidotransferase subunit C|nr:Asp-tRNA(Asn)/Glu-tRNA(Gln) amidotransferase GatCAB subunit C [bacterium]